MLPQISWSLLGTLCIKSLSTSTFLTRRSACSFNFVRFIILEVCSTKSCTFSLISLAVYSKLYGSISLLTIPKTYASCALLSLSKFFQAHFIQRILCSMIPPSKGCPVSSGKFFIVKTHVTKNRWDS